jgi:hypothetical protein
MASARRFTLPLVMPATEILPSLVAYTECCSGVSDCDYWVTMSTYLLGERLHLLRLQTRVCKHANLRGNVAPVVLAAELLEILLEQGAHRDDAVSHVLNLAEPLLVQRGVVQDLGSNTGPVHRRVGVERAHENLDLRIHTLLLIRGLAHNGEGTNALAVETLIHQYNRISSNSYHVPCSWQSSERALGGGPP